MTGYSHTNNQNNPASLCLDAVFFVTQCGGIREGVRDRVLAGRRRGFTAPGRAVPRVFSRHGH